MPFEVFAAAEAFNREINISGDAVSFSSAPIGFGLAMLLFSLTRVFGVSPEATAK